MNLSKDTTWSKHPIGTVSYNTIDGLNNVLKYLIVHDYIFDFFYIQHKGEDDKKDHIHLLVFPLRSLNLIDLRSLFSEEVDDGEPLGVMPFRVTLEKNVRDWILYCLHDPQYLQIKGKVKQIQYTLDDFKYHNKDHFMSYISDIKSSKSDIMLLCRYLEEGYEWYQAADAMQIKRNDLFRFKQAYETLATSFYGFEDFSTSLIKRENSLRSLVERHSKEFYLLEEENAELRENYSRACDLIDQLLEFKQIKLEDIEIHESHYKYRKREKD